MAKRAKGYQYPNRVGKSGGNNDNTKALKAGRKSVKVLSSEDHKYVGRPGFGGFTTAGPSDGRKSVRRLYKSDPSKGQAAYGNITTAKVDLIGNQNPTIVAKSVTASPNQGKSVVRPPRKSKPVYSNKPGKVTRRP